MIESFCFNFALMFGFNQDNRNTDSLWKSLISKSTHRQNRSGVFLPRSGSWWPPWRAAHQAESSCWCSRPSPSLGYTSPYNTSTQTQSSTRLKELLGCTFHWQKISGDSHSLELNDTHTHLSWNKPSRFQPWNCGIHSQMSLNLEMFMNLLPRVMPSNGVTLQSWVSANKANMLFDSTQVSHLKSCKPGHFPCWGNKFLTKRKAKKRWRLQCLCRRSGRLGSCCSPHAPVSPALLGQETQKQKACAPQLTPALIFCPPGLCCNPHIWVQASSVIFCIWADAWIYDLCQNSPISSKKRRKLYNNVVFRKNRQEVFMIFQTH